MSGPDTGRPIEESRALAIASLRRYERIGEVWDDLTDAEQQKLVELAERVASEGRERDG